jgi:Protein of unknown function (DUF2934)
VLFFRAFLFPNSILIIQISFAFFAPFALIMVTASLEACSSASGRSQISDLATHGQDFSKGRNRGRAAGHGLNEELMARTNGNGSATHSKSPSTKKLTPQQKIQMRAYEIYLERNGAPGNPLEDWVRAEREVLQKTRKNTKKTATAAA